MIQAADVLGRKYKDVKNLIVGADFDPETLKSFSANAINPGIGKATFTEDLYFFGSKIDRYKTGFRKNRIDEIVFIKEKDEAISMIDDLIALNSFEFKFVTEKQMKGTPFEVLTDNSEIGMNFAEFKIQRFESDPSSQFDIKDIDQYACLTFRSDNCAVIIHQEYTENESFFVFELHPVDQ